MITVSVGLRKGNCRNVIGEILNTATVLRAVVKFHKGLIKEKKVFAGGCFGRNLTKKKAKVKFTWSVLPKKRSLHTDSNTNTFL